MRGLTFAIAVCSASFAQAASIVYVDDAPEFAVGDAPTLTLPQFDAAAVSPGAVLLGVRLEFAANFRGAYSLSCLDLGFSTTPCSASGTGPGGAYLAGETTVEGTALDAPVTLGFTGGVFGDLTLAVGEAFDSVDVTGSDSFEKLMGPSDAFIGSGDLVFTLSASGQATDDLTGGASFSIPEMYSDARLRLTYEYEPFAREASSEVPLPAAAPLLVAALGWLGLRSRRRRG